MPRRLPKIESEPSTCDPRNPEDSDSDLIFEIEMEDRTAVPTLDYDAMDVDDTTSSNPTGVHAASTPGNGREAVSSAGGHRSTSAPASLCHDSPEAQSTPVVDAKGKSAEAEDSSQEDVAEQSSPALDAKAEAFLAKLRQYQRPAQQPFWSQNNMPQAGSSNAFRGASHPTYSSRATSNSPLKPHAHQLHQSHHYVTGRGYGSSLGQAKPDTPKSTNNQHRHRRNNQADEQRRQNRSKTVYPPQSNLVPPAAGSFQHARQYQAVSYAGTQFQPHLQPQTSWPANTTWASAHHPGYVSAQYAQHQLTTQPYQWQNHGYFQGQSMDPRYGAGGIQGLQASTPWSRLSYTQQGHGTFQPYADSAAAASFSTATKQASVNKDPAQSVIVSSRPLIVNGSKHNYDVEKLNQFDDDLPPSASASPATGAFLSSMASESSRMTEQSRLTGNSPPFEPALVSSPGSSASGSGFLAEKVAHQAVKDIPPACEKVGSTHSLISAGDAGFLVPPHPSTYNKVEASTYTRQMRQASRFAEHTSDMTYNGLTSHPTTDSGTVSLAMTTGGALGTHESQALIRVSDNNHWLLKLPPALWQRLTRYIDDATLMNLSTMNRMFAHARVERVLRTKKRSAKLAELEERSTFVTSQLNRLLLTPHVWHPDHKPRYSKACFHCYHIRQEMHFPKIFTQSGASDVPDKTDSVPIQAAPSPLLYRDRPLYVPYIPVPCELTPKASAFVDGPSSSKRLCSGLSDNFSRLQIGSESRPEYVEHFDRCCFECAVKARLINPGERIVAMDGSWRWVCKCRLLHYGSTDGYPCHQCQDVPY